MSYPRKYPDGWAHVNLLMPKPLHDRLRRLAHERSKQAGKTISKCDVINRMVKAAIDDDDRPCWTGVSEEETRWDYGLPNG